MSEIIDLKWKRPVSSVSKVWSTFEAKNVDSDDLIEYRIQDLPESRFEEALENLVSIFCKDEPLCEAYEVINDPDAIEDYRRMWNIAIQQKCALVCFKDGSDEIVGLNINFVTIKDEHIMEELRKQNKSPITNKVYEIFALLCGTFDACEYYGVDKYLSSVGLIVSEKYRGRGIGEQLLKVRKIFCQAFDIKLTSTAFTSNFSNKIADKVGFELVKRLSYDDTRTNHPQIELPPIRSDALTLKSIVF